MLGIFDFILVVWGGILPRFHEQPWQVIRGKHWCRAPK